jgi:hypothetical protein
MGISYDPPSKKWNVVYEKTDYRTDYPIDNSSMPTLAKYGLFIHCNANTMGSNGKKTNKMQQNLHALWTQLMKAWDTNQQLNNNSTQWNNADITALRQQNTYKNQAYDNTVASGFFYSRR